jgi:IS5 family transposase
MSEQRTLGSMAYDAKGKVTRRERFLREMDVVIPWASLLALVAPHYTKPGRGRRPLPLETMLRVYFLQQWFDLSDPQAEDMLYDSESMRRFARVELGEDTVPDESTILRFRHLLEEHQLTAEMFATVRTLLEEKRLLLKAGTIVDATILAAPSSTKNATKTRDPEMHQTRKGNQWYFGMKVHVGTDTQGLVHTVTTTDAAQADITQLPELLHGAETTLYGDKAYYKADDKLNWECSGGKYRVNKSGKRTAKWDKINAARSRVRARGEHVFRVMKCQWGFTKVRYRGLMKNTTRILATLALANLYQVRHRLRLQGT